MKKIFLIIALALPLVMVAQEETKTKTYKPSVKLKTLKDSVSYAMGIDTYQGITRNMADFGVDFDIYIAAIKDAMKDKPGFTTEEMQSVAQSLQADNQRRMEIKYQENLAAGQKFLDENKKNKSVIVTASGLQYKVEKEGDGNQPTMESTITCHYTGTLIDGTKFDSSYDRNQPITVPLAQLIPGWGEGLQLMKTGAKYTFYIPNELAYGKQQAGTIPPGATVIFEVELINVDTPAKVENTAPEIK